MPRISSKLDHDGALAQIGAAIRRRRMEINLSQESLADLAHIDRSHMGRIERGERNASVLNLLRIAEALEIQLSMLLLQADL